MFDYYRAPSLVLTLLLLPAFAFLYRRYRNTRTLLWLLGFLAAAARMGVMYLTDDLGLGTHRYLWLTVAGLIFAQFSSGLFLASLSPIKVYIWRIRALYVFVAPLLLQSLIIGFADGLAAPLHGPLEWSFLLLGGVAAAAAVTWSLKAGGMPAWLGSGLCLGASLFSYWIYFTQGAVASLYAIDATVHFVTAILVIAIFRRLSAGVFLTVAGFLAWSLLISNIFPSYSFASDYLAVLVRVVVFSKVAAAMGMILVTLEDELAGRASAQRREQRTRREVEAYATLVRSHHKTVDFDAKTDEICQAICTFSRFCQAALLLKDSFGRYRIVAAAGFTAEGNDALRALVGRIPAGEFLAPGTAAPLHEHISTLRISLAPWLAPKDDLIRLGLTEAFVFPLVDRSEIDGAILLFNLRDERVGAQKEIEPLLRADDLMPLEMLANRLGSARRQTVMTEKLLSAEKFAAYGELSGGVAVQLNDPLTVILGYAALLKGSSSLRGEDVDCVEAILTQAQRMKSILDSLARISSAGGDQRSAISLADLIPDLIQVHRTEFTQRAIDFQLHIDPNLPRVRGYASQVRQAIQQCLRFGLAAIESAPAAQDGRRSMCMEVSREGRQVQIKMIHFGLIFPDPDRVFDAPAEGPRASDLSLCAALMEENGGRAFAENLTPSGAAIILELQTT
jgi:hypothetical protein